MVSPTATSHSWLAAQLGVNLDPELLVLALTHRSFANEHGGIPTNERLEFLGDAVLGMIIAEQLYRRFPDLPESRLTQMRASLVSQEPLAGVARRIGLGKFLLLGKGESDTGGQDKDSILSDTVEALIGAVYLSLGIAAAETVVERLLGPLLAAVPGTGINGDAKTELIEYCAAHDLSAPEYQIISSGPAHALRFTAEITVAGHTVIGEGTAKKRAELAAARELLEILGARSESAEAISDA